MRARAGQAVRIIGIGGDDALKRRFVAFANLSTVGRVNAIGSFAAATAQPAERAGVHGNALHGYGRSPVAQVLVTGTCRLSDNECAVLGSRAEAAVDLTATSIIASANRVEETVLL